MNSKETFSVYTAVSYMLLGTVEYDFAIALYGDIYHYICREMGEESEAAMLSLGRMAAEHYTFHYLDDAVSCYEKVVNWFLEHPNFRIREPHQFIKECGNAYLARYRISKDPSDTSKAYYYYTKAQEYGECMCRFAIDNQDEHLYYFEYQHKAIYGHFSRYYLVTGNEDLADKYSRIWREQIESFANYPNISTDADLAAWNLGNAEILMLHRDYESAIQALKAAFQLWKKCFSEKHPRVLDVLCLLIQCLIQIEKNEEAGIWLEIASEIAKSTMAADHPAIKRLRDLRREQEKILDQLRENHDTRPQMLYRQL